MKEAVQTLLRIELNAAIASIGFEDTSEDLITEENLYKVINAIERLVLANGNGKHIAAMCGLLWTHFHDRFDLIGEYVYSTMAKIGFSPVSKMLRNQEGKLVESSIFGMLEGFLQSQRFTVEALGKRLAVTEFQKRLWDELNTSQRVAVSAPTSAGKSYLLCLRAVQNAANYGGVSFYIVPTVTLMNQVASDLFQIARENDTELRILTSLGDAIDDTSRPVFYVLTQERITEGVASFRGDEFQLTQLIVDEVQNIERAFDVDDSNPRAKLLMDVIVELHDRFKPKLSVVSGPRISDIRSMATSLFNADCVDVSTTSSPVVNIAYSILPAGSRVEIKQFSELTTDHLSRSLHNEIGATGFGKKTYTDQYHRYLFNVLRKNKGGLVFSPTTGQCRKTALAMSANLQKSTNRRIVELSDYIRTTVSPTYDLADCIERQVAFHHSKLPLHIRNAVEFAISRSIIDHVVCTTTLMQGVNIPAKTVVLRNPSLFVRSTGDQAPVLSNYEIANLRGRAGRLLRDFVGRTFILDGTSFQESEVQTSLFKPAEKKLDGSYSKIFEENRDEIMHTLTSQEEPERPNSVASYIASAIYTEQQPRRWLARKGIEMSTAEVGEVQRRLAGLIVDRTVCRKFRYWNPFELDKLARHSKAIHLPTSVYSAGLADQLQAAILRIRALLPDRAHKYLGGKNLAETVLPVFASNTVKWAREVPLFNILDTPYCRKSADNTESAISMLQKDISYGLPSLLGPVYAIKQQEPSLLSQIERGASSEESRLLMNSNIPREVAIMLTRLMKSKDAPMEGVSDAIRFVKRRKLRFWDAVHFKHLVELDEIVA